MEYAKRWGYDYDANEFSVQLDASAPAAKYTLSVRTESENAASINAEVSGGETIRVKVNAKEGEGIAGKLLIGDEQVDTMWVQAHSIDRIHDRQEGR